jgi:RecA-family ATPase
MLAKDPAGNLCETAFLEWLREWAKANGPWSLIVLDPLSRFAGPDAEIDNAAATRFVQALESLASVTGATVLVAHHTNKLARRGGVLEASAGRGSSALVDGVRWVAALGVERLDLDDPDERARLGEVVTWSLVKSNYGRRADEVLLRRDNDNGGALVPLDETDLETVRQARGGEAARQAKTTQREAEREQVRSERDRKEAERRAAREAAAAAARRLQHAEDDDAARAVLEAHPNLAQRDQVAKVKAARACSTARAHDAILRVRGGAS